MKKLLSLLLAIIMVFTCVSVAFAAEDYKQTCPVIFVPGFSSSTLYSDVTDEDTSMSFPGVDAILEAVKDTLLPALASYAVTRDTDKLTDTVTKRINVMFEGWFNESDGSVPDGSGIIPEKLRKVTKNSRLVFRYDWRDDPMVIADELNAYINKVCKLSGCDKVALGCHSLGSTVALAYLSKYGNSKVSAMVFDSPACNGVAVVGNVLTGEVNLDADGLAFFAKSYLGESEYQALIRGIIDIFKSAGLLDLLSLVADEVIAELAPGIYRGTVAPLIGRWLTIWSMLPDEKMAQAKAYIFDEILKDEDTAALEKRIDNYNKTVRNNKEKTLKAFDKVGKFAILSRYGDQVIPLRSTAMNKGDLIIETSATSFGAVTAPIGDYFSDEYLKGKDLTYISPDRTVDATNCLFREKTWFIKNSGHFETGGITENYYDMFFFSKKELTCKTAPLPRFTYRDDVTYTLIEDTTTPEKAADYNLAESIYNFAIALIATVKNLIKNAV